LVISGILLDAGAEGAGKRMRKAAAVMDKHAVNASAISGAAHAALYSELAHLDSWLPHASNFHELMGVSAAFAGYKYFEIKGLFGGVPKVIHAAPRAAHYVWGKLPWTGDTTPKGEPVEIADAPPAGEGP
jgi:hypothetical protein